MASTLRHAPAAPPALPTAEQPAPRARDRLRRARASPAMIGALAGAAVAATRFDVTAFMAPGGIRYFALFTLLAGIVGAAVATGGWAAAGALAARLGR